MEEYKNQRTMIGKDLERQFARLYPRGKNAGLEVDGFLEIVGGTLPSDANKQVSLENPFLRWPGRISQVRAYIYAIAATEKNDTFIPLPIFQAACARFALESPTPTLTLKLALYGNSYDVMKIIE